MAKIPFEVTYIDIYTGEKHSVWVTSMDKRTALRELPKKFPNGTQFLVKK